MTKKIDEMTKEELIEELIKKTNHFYDLLVESELMYGYDSYLTKYWRSMWVEFDRFCTNLDIDPDRD